MKHLTTPLLIVLAAASAAVAQPVVDAPCGSVEGVQSKGVRVFRGIPYAEAPTGNRRWKAPVRKAVWSGVRDCSAFGPICPQDAKGNSSGTVSEDCLNLNVYTPKQVKSPLPVLVWVHGGAFLTGSGSARNYDGSKLAKAGAVVVTINYRLGPLGFIAHPGLSAEAKGESGNYGVQDVIEALRWVQTNARSFGGDPSKVTVFGQSAGGATGRVLLASPLARGLFHRVIMQSGPAGHLPHLTKTKSYMPPAEQFGVEFAQRVLGKTLSDKEAVKQLRKAKVEDLLANKGGRADMLDYDYTYGPVIGGSVLPEDPFAVLEDGLNNVPVIVGSTSDEAAQMKSNFPEQTAREFRAYVQDIYGTYADELLSELGTVRTKSQAHNALGRLFGDERFVMIARLGAKQLSRRSAKVYLYSFTKGSAAHGADISYVFGNVRDADQQALSDAMLAAWIRFAKTGDPNGGSLPNWPPYTSSNDKHLEFGDSIRVGQGWRSSTCDLLEEKFLEDRQLP